MVRGVGACAISLVTLCREAHIVASSCSEAVCTSAEAEIGRSLLQSRSSYVSKASEELGKARSVLPKEIFEIGLHTFDGSEEKLDKVVKESVAIDVTYAGVPLLLRILAKDTAAKRLGAETEDGQAYGLDTLLAVRENKNDMVNMIDLGGNYGAVTIAVYKKYPGLLRTVVVEPVAATYFFLRWNMFLNKVPHVTQKEFVKDPTKPGVVALHRGVMETSGEDLQLCFHPEWSMNAKSMFIAVKESGCDCSFMDCRRVPGITTESIFDDYFGQAPITLMKMDCEGCEFNTLPVLNKHPERVKRLAGELHMPSEDLIDYACHYDNGKYLTKVCRLAEAEWGSALPLGCRQQRKECNWH